MQASDILSNPAHTITLEGDQIGEYCDFVHTIFPWAVLERLRAAKRIRLVKEDDPHNIGVLSRVTYIDE